MKRIPTSFSSVDNLPIRKSGDWIKRKYHYLRRYLNIFTVGMGKKWDLSYVDLFAGSGRCIIGNSDEEIDGSALISLNYKFDHYVFVEKDPTNLKALNARCKRSLKFDTIKFVEGDCNRAKDGILPEGLAVAFADPTGIDLHFDTIRTLATGRGVDLLMTVMEGMDVKRNLQRYRQQGDLSDLGKFLGGSVPWDRIQTSRDAMIIYKERLQRLGYQIVEYKDITIRNNKNVPMYFLMFASKHPKGLEFWEKISAIDEMGQQELF